MQDVESVIKHHGVKGMRWGVRKAKPGKITLRDKLSSMKRERQWSKVLGEMDNLSNDQIALVSKRIGMENELKRLSKKSPAAKKSDKLDYVKRADLDNDQLNAKVVRLRAKDQLVRSVKDASKEQREMGEKAINVSSALALKYVTTKSITPKDVISALENPSPIKDKAVKDFIESLNKRSPQQ